MRSLWKVSSNVINDYKMYIVYRLKDIAEVDHSGNREYTGNFFDTKVEAQSLANKLNEEDMEND